MIMNKSHVAENSVLNQVYDISNNVYYIFNIEKRFQKIFYEEHPKMSNLPGIFYLNLPDILYSK